MSKVVERQAIVPFSAQQMYDLVNDIEAYPQYMSGCVGASILERGEGWLVAKLDLAKAGFKQSFTTKNTLQPPHTMNLELVDGPFKMFKGTWSFSEIDTSACQVHFRLQYAFASKLLDLAAGGVMNQLAGEQVENLCQRAKALYQCN